MFAVKGLSASNGWYLYAVVVAELVLATIGLWNLFPAKARPLVLPCGALLFAALDLYGANFLLAPYYSGMIAHRANGTFEVFRIGQFSSAVLYRLGGDHPSLFGALWILSIVATLALPLIAYRVSTAPAPGAGSQR